VNAWHVMSPARCPLHVIVTFPVQLTYRCLEVKMGEDRVRSSGGSLRMLHNVKQQQEFRNKPPNKYSCALVHLAAPCKRPMLGMKEGSKMRASRQVSRSMKSVTALLDEVFLRRSCLVSYSSTHLVPPNMGDIKLLPCSAFCCNMREYLGHKKIFSLATS
jgi:hypothetical protein